MNNLYKVIATIILVVVLFVFFRNHYIKVGDELATTRLNQEFEKVKSKIIEDNNKRFKIEEEALIKAQNERDELNNKHIKTINNLNKLLKESKLKNSKLTDHSCKILKEEVLFFNNN